jgi:hypothetical protein
MPYYDGLGILSKDAPGSFFFIHPDKSLQSRIPAPIDYRGLVL